MVAEIGAVGGGVVLEFVGYLAGDEQQAYGRLGAGVAIDLVVATVAGSQLGGLLVRAVEVVIRIRSRGNEVCRGQAHAIAATCLRMCGVSEERVARAAAIAEELLPTFVEDPLA